jgi:hypothetical protein
MFKKIKIIVAFSVLTLASSALYSQLGVTGYSINAVGFNSNFDKAVTGELKLFTNSSLKYSEVEFDLFFNLSSKDYHRFSLGVGLNTLPFQGYEPLNTIVLPARFEVFPIQGFRRLSLVGELSPELSFERVFYVRYLWGVKYTFERKNR